MTGAAAHDATSEHDDGGVPPDVAERIVRALDRSPSTIATLVDADLNIRWISRSATWIIGTDPDTRRGASSLERVHPDDVALLVDGLAQLRAAGRPARPAPVPHPIRYRLQRFDGRWVVMEAIVHNLLGDPVVEGLLVFSRPVSGALDGVGHVIDLLVAELPLPEVLAACADLVPDFLGAVAVVAFLDGGPVVGAPCGSPAERLASDPRWWQPATRGAVFAPNGFAGFPADLAAQGRAGGFRTAWVSPVLDPPTGDVIGCVVVWVKIDIERNMATDAALGHTTRLASLVIAEERRRASLRRQAFTDALTGLANRSALEQRLGQAPGEVTVAIVDLDHFKPVNDTHGHETGDAVLRVVAERLRGAVRDGDLAARYGGDEFAIVFAAGTDHADAVRSAGRVARAIEEPIALGGGLIVSVGASVGVATAAADDVAHLADTSLYEAKRAKQGGGRAPSAYVRATVPPCPGRPVAPG